MEQAGLKKCQKILGYKFTDPELLVLALTHSSVAASHVESNERLEFLGDSVLGLVVCHELYERCSRLAEGELTKIKSSVVSGQTCSEIVQQLDIIKYVSLSKGLGGPAALPTSVSAALFEALIGAIYLDGGLEAARKFILTNIHPHMAEATTNRQRRNYKSLLQQYCQKRWNSTPEYQLLDEKGPDHDKAFEIGVAVDGVQFPSTWGRTKKEAEQLAARQALVKLDSLQEESTPKA